MKRIVRSTIVTFGIILTLFITIASGLMGTTAKAANVNYSDKVPLKAYTLYTGKLTTYSSIGGSKTGYINGSSDLCTIKEIYSNGWVKVSYPLDAGGTKTAYCKLADFVANPSFNNVRDFKATQRITTYKRSSGSAEMGYIDNGDISTIVSKENGRYQAIYPLSGGGYKLGWFDASFIDSAPTTKPPTTTTKAPTTTKATTVATTAALKIGGVSYATKTPIKAYTLYTGKLTTYSSVGGNQTGYINGSKDLCTVKEIYTNGWVKVSYPLDGGGSKTAFCKLADFVANPNFNNVRDFKATQRITTYKRSSGSAEMGYIDNGDISTIVSKENGRYQAIYPVAGGGYKLGWFDASFIDSAPTTKPSTTTVSKRVHVQKNTTVKGGPSNSYADIGTVFSSDNISVLYSDGSYYEIEYPTANGAKRGYVSKSLVVNAPSVAAAPNSNKSAWATQSAETYGGPGSGYAAIGSVSKAEKVTTLRTEKNYYLIEYNTASGLKRAYISKNLITFDNPNSVTSIPNVPNTNITNNSSNAQVRAAIMKILYGGDGGKMTCDYDGYISTPGRHEGIDFSIGRDHDVYSVVNGEVIRAKNGTKGPNGTLSIISIYDRTNNKTVIYLHIGNITVSEKQPVKVGQKIAEESNCGCSDPHTHIEVRDGRSEYAAYSVNNYTLENSNPYPYWRTLMASYNTTSNAPSSSVINDTSNCKYSISNTGLEFIKKWEGFRGYVYDDGAGYATIGYGHLIRSGEKFTTITEPEALALLKSDINGSYTTKLNSFLKSNGITVTQAQYDALLSFTFNVGSNVWNSSFTLRSLLLKYKDGSAIPSDAVYDAFGRWKYAGGKVMPGLVNRRTAEAKMFVNG